MVEIWLVDGGETIWLLVEGIIEMAPTGVCDGQGFSYCLTLAEGCQHAKVL